MKLSAKRNTWTSTSFVIQGLQKDYLVNLAWYHSQLWRFENGFIKHLQIEDISNLKGMPAIFKNVFKSVYKTGKDRLEILATQQHGSSYSAYWARLSLSHNKSQSSESWGH